MDKNIYFLAFLHSAGFTHKDLKKIFETHENYEEIYEWFITGKKRELPWMTDERKAKILGKLQNINTEWIKKVIEEKEIQLITIHSSVYPEKLRTIKQAPYFLYVRWVLREERKMLGIVGSRKNTQYGKKILEKIIPELISAGCGIVSGWAYGIDAISHDITLQNNWYTLSVFGCSVDIYYPVQNTKLFDTILEKWWALVSIFPIGTQAEPYMFPIRNEIVAALSDGIIIPEAGVKSGTLITAGLALEHGRDVFAIPWDIFRETSEWCNHLIARGEAKCTRNASDILEEYFPNMSMTTASLFSEKIWESEIEKIIYTTISEWYNTPDSIWENTQYNIWEIITTLSLLEMNGHIRLGVGGKYEVL
jgi:DNA processing protein